MKEEHNLTLIIIGIVAIVAIVGLLNFSGITAKTTGHSKSVITTETGEIYYCNAVDCKDVCGKECIGVKTRAGMPGSYCPHNLFYDSLGTYYMHYFCG